jgi:hypothetical protein
MGRGPPVTTTDRGSFTVFKHRMSRVGLGAAVLVLIALATAGVAVATGDSPTTGSAGIDRGDATTFRLFGVPDLEAETFIPADGSDDEERFPIPGDRTVLRDVLYAVDETDPERPAATGDALGQALITCDVIIADEAAEDAELVCDAVVELDGRGTLTLLVSFAFSEFEDPRFITAAVTGGTGLYAGAGGEAQVRDLPRSDDPEGTSDSLYEFRL